MSGFRMWSGPVSRPGSLRRRVKQPEVVLHLRAQNKESTMANDDDISKSSPFERWKTDCFRGLIVFVADRCETRA